MSPRAILDVRTAKRMAKLLGMLGSSHDPEALTAARMADQLRRDLGLQWTEIIVPLSMHSRAHVHDVDWLDMVAACLQQAHRLNDRELEFLDDMHHWRHEPTEKQIAWITRIYQRVRAA